MATPRKLRAIVENVYSYKDGITRYVLKPEFKCRFKPGQFLHLALDSYDPSYNWPESRVFSIASSNKKDEIEILISPKGKFTNRMVNSLKVDDQVWIKLPYGEFNLNSTDSDTIILVAGGTGISPFIGFLEDLENLSDRETKVLLYYGVRSKDHIIYDDLLFELSHNFVYFNLDLFIENKPSALNHSYQEGIIDFNKIINETKDLDKQIYYVSGPPFLINTFIEEATAKGIDSDKIKFDKWD